MVHLVRSMAQHLLGHRTAWCSITRIAIIGAGGPSPFRVKRSWISRAGDHQRGEVCLLSLTTLIRLNPLTLLTPLTHLPTNPTDPAYYSNLFDVPTGIPLR
jgi:hypothetical protein